MTQTDPTPAGNAPARGPEAGAEPAEPVRRSIFDQTKAAAGAITMVYKDYELLRRWVDYYARQVGRRHLYVISHGNDPEHRRIAQGCNIIGVPRDPTLFRLDRRRWMTLSRLSAGLMRYYKWLFVNDIDELVVLDPLAGDSLVDYLMKRYDYRGAPKSVCPLGLELIHNPKIEPEKLDPDQPILSRRRVFRVNANYSKPCILRNPTSFTIGGHANTHLPRHLDPHLYLLHLRFYDHDASVARLTSRKEMRNTMSGEAAPAKSGQAWQNDLENYQRLASGEPVAEDVELTDFRTRMVQEQTLLHDGKVAFWGGGRTKELYRLPDRFARLV